MNLTTVGPESAQLLSKLSIDTFVQAYGDVHSPENLQVYCQQHYSPQAIEALLRDSAVQAIVAFDDKEPACPAGFYLLKEQACPVPLNGKSTELKQIYILSEYYGLGLGPVLFEHAVNSARAKQNDWLWLCVSDKNLRAQAFYGKLGFESVAEGPILTVGTDALPSSIMLLKL